MSWRRNTAAAAWAVAGLMAVAGCEPAGAPPAGGIAVVDMERVAKSTGRDAQMQQALNARTQQLDAQLQQVGQQLERRHAELASKMSDPPTTQQASEFQQADQEMRGEMQAAMARAQSIRQQALAEIRNSFREEIGRVAIEVAKRRGYSVVVSKAEPLLSWDPGADITDDVLAEYQKQAPGSGGSSTTGTLAPPPGPAPLPSFPGGPPGIPPGNAPRTIPGAGRSEPGRLPVFPAPSGRSRATPAPLGPDTPREDGSAPLAPSPAPESPRTQDSGDAGAGTEAPPPAP